MNVALVSQCVLAVRANWGIKMVLDLLGSWRSVKETKRIQWKPTYRLLESSLVCKESTSHGASMVVGVRIGRNRANGTGSHGSWGSNKRIKCTRGGDASVSITLKRRLSRKISTIAQNTVEPPRAFRLRRMRGEVSGRIRRFRIEFRCHGRQAT